MSLQRSFGDDEGPEAPIGEGVDEEPPPQAHSAAIYSTTIDLSDDNDAHTLVARMVGSSRRVLELGCATGSATKVFKEHGCAVTAIELDAEAAQLAKEWADEVIVGDLDAIDFRAALGDSTFDVIVAADVLEHLKDPAACLRTCLEHLVPNGEVVLSIPNIAHADARLALLRGSFDYQACGLLDETHLRFFTRRTLERFVADAGLVVLEWQRTTRSLGATEIKWVVPDDPALGPWALSQPDGDTYQFVLRAVVAPERGHLREVIDQLTAAERRVADLVRKLEAKDAEIKALRDRELELTREREAIEEKVHHLKMQTQQLHDISRERDEYKSAFAVLAGVEDELVAVRRSESYRLGHALLSPIVTARRVARAWKRAKR